MKTRLNILLLLGLLLMTIVQGQAQNQAEVLFEHPVRFQSPTYFDAPSTYQAHLTMTGAHHLQLGSATLLDIDGLTDFSQGLLVSNGGATIHGLTCIKNALNIEPLGGLRIEGNPVTTSALELNILDGAHINTTELNYLDNATSNIQNQIDALNGLTGATPGQVTANKAVVAGPSKEVTGFGDIALDNGQALYFGDPNTDGTWRIIQDGPDLAFQCREGGVWVMKMKILK